MRNYVTRTFNEQAVIAMTVNTLTGEVMDKEYHLAKPIKDNDKMLKVLKKIETEPNTVVVSVKGYTLIPTTYAMPEEEFIKMAKPITEIED